MAVGLSIAVIIGYMLGAGKTEEAKDADKKLIRISSTCAVIVGLGLAALSPLFPRLYETVDSVKALSSYMILVHAIMMPVYSYANAAYFTLRSGGRVFITVLFDSIFMWTVSVPAAFVLSYFTDLNIYVLFAVCQGTEILKAALGFALLRRGTWARRIIKDEAPAE